MVGRSLAYGSGRMLLVEHVCRKVGKSLRIVQAPACSSVSEAADIFFPFFEP